MKKILIFGIYGLLGNNIYLYLKNKYKIFGTCRLGKRLTNENNIYDFNHSKENIEKIINEIKPDIILNCIAKLRENSINEKEEMIYSNCLVPINISQICKKKNIYFIHFSTDAVFNISKNYNQIDKLNNPDTFYGMTKCISEQIKDNALVLRVCPIGYSLYNNRSFFNFIYNNKSDKINGYTDCFFNGTTTIIIIKELEKIINSNNYIFGLRHISSYKISKYNLLKIINDIFELKKKILPNNEVKVCRLLKNDLVNFNKNWKEQIKELKENMYLFKL